MQYGLIRVRLKIWTVEKSMKELQDMDEKRKQESLQPECSEEGLNGNDR